MNKLFFENVLLPQGWAHNVSIEVDGAGVITAIKPDQSSSSSNGKIAVAGMANLHSHAFQRAMAGLGEWAGQNADDSFWSWREVMYDFVQKLRPRDLHAIASQLYVEMLEAGFTAVGEFHYLHHQADGRPYDNLIEMSEQVMNAAQQVGIAQTLLPVFYQYGGFGNQAINDHQKRFANDTERFLALVKKAHGKANGRNMIGIAPHSLRAVSPESLKEVMAASSNYPIHIHIAEQVKEVEDCIAWSGARPVQWLLDNVEVSDRWCLVHATHLNDNEIDGIANAKAVAGLCPITEANLGDGIFDGVKYHGKWGIGSDSNIRICVAEELRTLEYSQRLRDLKRNRLTKPHQANGRALFDKATKGGAQALGQPMGSLQVGKMADIVSLDAHHPALIGRMNDNWLNGWIFSGDAHCVKDVWVSGKHIIKQGRHPKRQSVVESFAATMQYLMQ